MSVVLDVALPVFAILLCGWLAGRTRLLGGDAAQALNTFVYWFALPPVLFLGMAREPLGQALHGPFIAAFLLALAATALLSMAAARVAERGVGLPDLVQHGLNACFSNTGYMGIPLFLAAFGPLGLAPAILATVLVSSLVVGIAVVGMEAARARDAGVGRAALVVLRSLAGNPLVMAPLVGIAVSGLGLELPRPLVTFGDLMGSAAGPCALFAIGLFLAGRPMGEGLVPEARASAVPVVLKLLVQPALALLLVTRVFPMEPFWAAACVLLSGLPTGALTFVVAQRYGVMVGRTSTVILVSTLASIATLTGMLAALTPLPPPG